MKLLTLIKEFKYFLDKHNISYKKYIYITIFTTIISSIVSLVLPYIAKLEIDQLQYQNIKLFNIDAFYVFIFISIFYVTFNITEKYLNMFFQALLNKYYNNISLNITKVFINRISNSEYWIFFDNKTKEILEHLTNNGTNLLNEIIYFLSRKFSILLFLTWIIFIFSQINIYIIPILFLWAFIQYKLENYLTFLDKNSELNKLNDNINLKITQRMIMWHPVEVITNNLLPYLKQKLDKLKNTFIEEEYKLELARSKYHTIWASLSIIIEFTIKISVWYTIFYYNTSIGTITMTILFANKITDIFRTIFFLKKDLITLTRKFDLFKLFLEITYNKNIWEIKELKLKKIDIKNLDFKYPKSNKFKEKFYKIEEDFIKRLSTKDLNHKKEWKVENPIILRNININFEKGKIYWIIWKNWAWKSTLLKLLLKAFNTNSFFFNDICISNIHRNFFQNNVWIITQIPMLLSDTIKNNICLWKTIEDDKIYNYLKIFWLESRIRELPEKLNSKIWQDVDLSWWEKQIIAIIRILIQNNQILILDEWSNQLDVENENKLIKLLHQEKKDKIIIFVTHRMTIINKADFIYCLDDKTIVDKWTPQELLSKNSLFKKFYNLEISR